MGNAYGKVFIDKGDKEKQTKSYDISYRNEIDGMIEDLKMQPIQTKEDKNIQLEVIKILEYIIPNISQPDAPFEDALNIFNTNIHIVVRKQPSNSTTHHASTKKRGVFYIFFCNNI